MIEVTPLPLRLKHAFRISYGSSTVRNNALVRIGNGYGEAVFPPYYPTKYEDVVAYVHEVEELLIDALRSNPIDLVGTLNRLPPGPSPAIAAIDQALHDVWGKQIGKPLFQLLGLGATIPKSSYALPIPETIADLDDQLEPFLDFPFLKLKIGSGNEQFDEAIVRRTRERYRGSLCVDVNAGWSLDVAIKMIPQLADLDLAFIEQPFKASDNDDWHLLKRMLPNNRVPLIADESVQGPNDIIELAGAANGVNIKLAKCGGIQPALRMIHLARSLDLSVMLGCMIESSVALTAAAHLGGLVDYLDLDGQLHLADDPFSGLSFDSGTITLPETPGLGISPR